MSINVLVDHDADEVTLTFTGPLNEWFAYGFNNTVMSGTHVVTMERSVSNDNIINERQLAARGSGTVLDRGFTIVSETEDASTRTIIIKIPASADPPYYSFPTAAGNVSIISAGGFGPSLAFHGSDNYMQGFQGGINDLEFSEIVPVTWSGFRLSAVDTKTILQWSTEEELNNEGFFVQRSIDRKEWEDLAFVDGKNERGADYRYVDETSLPGVNYYRLRQVDLDGSTHYSVIKSIEVSGNDNPGEIVVLPNPVADRLGLKGFQTSGQKRLQIYDMQYRVIADVVIPEGNQDFELDVQTLPAGHYLMMLKHKKWSHAGHFIKQ